MVVQNPADDRLIEWRSRAGCNSAINQLGILAIMEEFKLKANLTVKSDAVAAIGIVRRQGLGRIRHLAVADLWVQQRAKEGSVEYQKLLGTKNTSDMLTKPVEAEVIRRHMEELGLEFRGGRHEMTPEFEGQGGDDGVPAGVPEDEA